MIYTLFKEIVLECFLRVHFSRHGLIMSDILWPHWECANCGPGGSFSVCLGPHFGLLAIVPKFYLYSLNESSLFSDSLRSNK